MVGWSCAGLEHLDIRPADGLMVRGETSEDFGAGDMLSVRLPEGKPVRWDWERYADVGKAAVAKFTGTRLGCICNTSITK